MASLRQLKRITVLLFLRDIAPRNFLMPPISARMRMKYQIFPAREIMTVIYKHSVQSTQRKMPVWWHTWIMCRVLTLSCSSVTTLESESCKFDLSQILFRLLVTAAINMMSRVLIHTHTHTSGSPNSGGQISYGYTRFNKNALLRISCVSLILM